MSPDSLELALSYGYRAKLSARESGTRLSFSVYVTTVLCRGGTPWPINGAAFST